VNVAFNNDEAISEDGLIKAELRRTSYAPHGDVMYLDNLWDGTIARFKGRFGVYADCRVSKRVSLGVEVNANTTSDMYNSKDASNLDWYFNALAGVKVRLGKITKQVEKKACCGHEKVVEKIVEKIVEKPVEKIVYRDREVIKVEPLRKDIFFTISNSDVSRAEMVKVEDIATYLNKYPNAKVTITGYADKGTGSAKINEKLAKKRSEIVAELLKNKFGIASDRITVESKGDTVQPFEQNDLNRVSICVAE
jgi:outer membrane protein OmpA-like peptidoglycan-associated protein